MTRGDCLFQKARAYAQAAIVDLKRDPRERAEEPGLGGCCHGSQNCGQKPAVHPQQTQDVSLIFPQTRVKENPGHIDPPGKGRIGPSVCAGWGKKQMQDDIILSVLKAVSQNEDARPASDDPPKQAEPEPTGRSLRWNLPGFCAKARVTTSFGELPIEALRLRDPVKTISGDFKRVVWVDQMHLDEGFLDGFQDACPIRMQRNALGPGCPKENVLLSPGQQLIPPREWSNGTRKSAAELENRPNVDRVLATHVTYYLFHCGEPELVQVEGMWCAVAP